MPSQVKTDDELIKKFEVGDRAAFQELLLKNLWKTHHHFRNISNKNEADPTLTHKILDSFFCQVDVMITNRDFRKFLDRIIAHTCVMHIKDSRKEKNQLIDTMIPDQIWT